MLTDLTRRQLLSDAGVLAIPGLAASAFLPRSPPLPPRSPQRNGAVMWSKP